MRALIVSISFTAPAPAEKLARRIAAVDAALDREVYALYGLTEAEIALVEGQK